MALAASIYDGLPRHPFRAPPALRGRAERHAAVVLGAGPVGLTLAAGLARHGLPCVVVEPRDGPGYGSRAICISRRSLDILEGFGVADRILAKLARLLARELDDPARFAALVETALRDLE